MNSFLQRFSSENFFIVLFGVCIDFFWKFAPHFEDSVSYGVFVEKNRQFLATRHTVEYDRNRRTLFGFSVVARRLAMPFLLEGRKGCAIFIYDRFFN
jgi:hypothetical protein